MVTGSEFSGLGDFSCCVEIFGGVDVVEADAAGIGSFEVFIGEDGDWWVVGAHGFFDHTARGRFPFRHCVGEIRDPLFTRVDRVERVEDAISSWNYCREIFWAVGACGCCHCGHEVSRYERMVAGDYEAERLG